MEHCAGMLDDGFSSQCRLDRLSFSVEELGSQLLFQFLNHGTQCGLSYLTVIGSFRKVSEPGQGQYVFKLL